jgi:plasmid stability protein
MSILYVRQVPEELSYALRVAAAKNRRTPSEEVIFRLSRSFEADIAESAAEYQPTTVKETRP